MDIRYSPGVAMRSSETLAGFLKPKLVKNFRIFGQKTREAIGTPSLAKMLTVGVCDGAIIVLPRKGHRE